MEIGFFSNQTDKVRASFKLLKNLSNQIESMNINNVIMKELSMSMGGDFEIAIDEDATIVRVGTAIFGDRVQMLTI